VGPVGAAIYLNKGISKFTPDDKNVRLFLFGHTKQKKEIIFKNSLIEEI